MSTIKHTDKQETWDTGSRRDSREGKGRFDLIPPYFLTRLARHYEAGAIRYGDRNWQKGQPLSRYLDSAMRHLGQVIDGATDEDHAAAVAWNMAGYIWTLKEIEQGRLPAELDDTGHAFGG